RPTNMVFQSYAIFPHLSVAENVAFGLRKKRDMDKAQKDEAVAQALDMVGLNGFGARQAHALSGGQRQRVALARALILKPSDLAAFEATGRAYLSFANRYPGHYVAMFESGISIQRTPALHAAATRAMGVLETAAVALSEHIPVDKRPPPQMFSAHIWALSHGVVELFARGSPGTKSPFPPEDLLESGIGIYLRGLGLVAPDE
uniref:WHG domain-containing protein n=1 Tax=Yoonia sp. TaxID=2212373 RepID=UPI00404752FC